MPGFTPPARDSLGRQRGRLLRRPSLSGIQGEFDVYEDREVFGMRPLLVMHLKCVGPGSENTDGHPKIPQILE